MGKAPGRGGFTVRIPAEQVAPWDLDLTVGSHLIGVGYSANEPHQEPLGVLKCGSYCLPVVAGGVEATAGTTSSDLGARYWPTVRL